MMKRENRSFRDSPALFRDLHNRNRGVRPTTVTRIAYHVGLPAQVSGVSGWLVLGDDTLTLTVADCA
jgi:hypothetical protein